MTQRSWRKLAWMGTSPGAGALAVMACVLLAGSVRAAPMRTGPLLSAATRPKPKVATGPTAPPTEHVVAESTDAEPAAGANGPGPGEGKHVVSGSDIIDTLNADGHFGTLVQALQTAGLTQLLKSKGPYTFFAPTDDAWKNLSSQTREDLLGQPSRLKAVLYYHILKARVDNVGLHKLRNALTMGGIVNIDYTSGVKVNSAVVTRADLLCRNGIVHAIDTVLIPQPRVSKKAAAPKPETTPKPARGSHHAAREKKHPTPATEAQ